MGLKNCENKYDGARVWGPNEAPIGSVSLRTRGKWKDRILCLERILDCKALM